LIRRLTLRSIRAYPTLQVELLGERTAFVGSNGSGKTTLLEAIHLLATLQSFRTARMSNLIATGSDEAMISGAWEDPTSTRAMRIIGGRRKLDRDGKASTVEHFCEGLAVVALAPEHSRLLSDGPEERRRFLDRLLLVLQPTYFETARRYRKALAHKQALLREELPYSVYADRVAPWNQELDQYGAEIRRSRSELIAKIAPSLQRHYVDLIGRNESVGLRHRCSEESMAEELERLGRAEHAAGRALVGPHRDDLELLLRERKAEEVCSQGERFSILLALKLAERDEIRAQSGREPTLLFDDLGATLDAERRERLLHEVLTGRQQLLVTTSDEGVAAALEAAGTTIVRKKVESKADGFSVACWLPR